MSESTKKNERELADAAWAKLQEKLAQEPTQPQWSRWSEQMAAEATAAPLTAAMAGEPAEVPAASPKINLGSKAPRLETETVKSKPSSSFASWLHRNKKWVASAAAVGVIAVTIATPSGNQALAAILNKFRMQQLTVVQENDLQTILNSAFGDGKERESINKFGTFSHTSGKSIGEVDPSEASKLVGHKIIIPSDYDAKNKIYVSPSTSLTFNMNVDEVNKAMKRLGATKLLPESVDGKPITLDMGAAVHLYVSKASEERGESKGYSFSQMPVPTITVDPSIPVAEALDAVLQFPLLPANLKESLQTAGVLQGGSVPLPIIENGQVEKIKLEGLDVIVSTNNYNQGKNAYYSATWVKQGQLFRVDGSNELTSRAALIAKVTELIKS
ncbi:hypothetical protein [Paenibacillus sp. UNC451MF]|uniref:hypothetical protein n=1 Tax=Paenibacillus sp. UNC451MF TaxID=1449063 RepID=UPI000567EA03|nr:hypothetical protein [Paenibacillus sp. UNC451MF]